VSDAQLPQLEERIQAALEKAIREKDSVQASPDLEPPINDDAMYLFRARYSIERELRRMVLVQIFIKYVFIWREALQILSGQDRGPNFRSGGCFSG
jgi:hypothetical protein